MLVPLAAGLGAAAVGLPTVLLYRRLRSTKRLLQTQDEAARRRIYELAILNELADRAGYSLNVEKIIDIIIGSLHQFIDYSAVSYLLLEPEKIIFKVHLEESVTRDFIDEVRDRMLKSLAALLNEQSYDTNQIEETLTGAILAEGVTVPVSSFFNIPLAIGDKVVGVLTVAHSKPGLYKEEEMTILYKITNQASQAVSRLQEVVKTQQRKMNAMVASMAEGVVMTDNDYRIVVVNPAARQAIGLTNKSRLTIFDFIDSLAGKYDIRGKLEESIKLNRVLTSDDLLLGDRFYRIIVSPVKSSFGAKPESILGGVVIFRDITRAKEIEQLREDFTSIMAHELRSPLVGIQKISELRAKSNKSVPAAKQRQTFRMISRSADDMLMLVSDMLDAAKIEAGQFQLLTKPTDLPSLIDDRLKLFAAQATQKNITLTKQLAPSTPSNIAADSSRLRQVINNLLSNALKFTSSGGSVTVQTLVHTPHQQLINEAEAAHLSWFMTNQTKLPNSPALILAVTDTGPGIPANLMPHLFKRFQQGAPTHTPTYQRGTGLGLFVIKGIIEAHGGTVGVASKVGQGSTFYITLPLP